MTNKKHTVDSLKFYLWQEVWVVMKDKGLDNTVITLDTQMLHHYSLTLPSESFSVYPILKTAEGDYDEDFNNQDEYHYCPDIEEALELLRKGYGAITNDKSHTGYIDLINKLPCVTHKMVEEGFEL